MSVTMTPGATVFTVIRRGASSTARARVKALIAPLLAA
jgi:threonine/homoserine/homoserine lactone efflux protein